MQEIDLGLNRAQPFVHNKYTVFAWVHGNFSSSHPYLLRPESFIPTTTDRPSSVSMSHFYISRSYFLEYVIILYSVNMKKL